MLNIIKKHQHIKKKKCRQNTTQSYKKPNKNKALKRIYEKLNLDPKTGLASSERLQEINESPKTMVDALVFSQDIVKTLNDRIGEYEMEDRSNAARQQDLAARKRHYLARIHRDFGKTQTQTNDKKLNLLIAKKEGKTKE